MAHERGESDWGDWLPRAIAAAEPDTVAIWYLGCNGFVLKAREGTVLFVDPYLGTGDPPRLVRMVPVPFDPRDVADADAVLATHEHSDHVHGPTQGPILERAGADYHAPADSLAAVEAAGWTDEWDLADDQLVEVAAGDAPEVGPFTIHVEPANDPDATQPVSYVIDHPTGTFFHGGDARPGEPFERVGERYDLDLGALAFGSEGRLREDGEWVRKRWYSGENEVVRAANQLRLDRLLPTHWDVWRGLTADPTALHDHAASFEHPARLEIVEIGDRVDL